MSSVCHHHEARDLFDELPDDLVTCILCSLSSTSHSPKDFISILLTCKRLNQLGLKSMVLAKSSMKVLSFRAKNWCTSAHSFLKQCADSGNVEACYTLGMIHFYCLQNRGGGASLMAKAAINSHAPALYSLAVIQFNGSGSSKNDKDLRAGVALCARAAFFGHVDALRELGHCLQDGYGVHQNMTEGRRFLVQANARELSAHPPATGWTSRTGMGMHIPVPEAHPVSRFLTEWFSGGEDGLGLRMCSHDGCGRPETRKHEFRRCSICGSVNYCSRACQALDWKMRHKAECVPLEIRWVDEHGDGIVGGGVDEIV